MDKSLLVEDWFEGLVTDVKAIVVEGEFVSRWSLIETYHEVGKRILKENDNFKRRSIYGKGIAKNIGEAIGKSERTINLAVQFAKTYPVLDEAPFSKNISWTKVVNELLPENPPDKKIRRCPWCHNDLSQKPTEPRK